MLPSAPRTRDLLARPGSWRTWLSRHHRDVGAGVTTAIMLIPQAMAYAVLAGLPPIAGLYAALVPPIVYAVFGSSRQLAVGPVAMDSLLVAAALAAVVPPDADSYWLLASALAIMVGLIQLTLGVTRTGSLVRLMPRSVIAGFTSGAALLIALSQAGPLLGLSLERGTSAAGTVLAVMARVDQIHGPTLALGLTGVAVLIALSRLAPRAPRALVVVVLGTLAVWLFGLVDVGVAIVGEVPRGLPSPRVPLLDPGLVATLMPSALVIALISFLESYTSGLAAARSYEPTRAGDGAPNRELIAVGLANLGAGLTRGYPVAGGLSRTAVNAEAGARSRLAGAVTAALVGLTLIALTPAFYLLPKPVLSAIIVVAVSGLVDVASARRFFREDRQQLVVMLATFTATLTLGLTEGVALGVALAFALRATERLHVAFRRARARRHDRGTSAPDVSPRPAKPGDAARLQVHGVRSA